MTSSEDICAYCTDESHCEQWCNGKSFQPSRRVKEACERQIPKKMVFIHPLQENDIGDYMCPSCKSGTVYDAYGNIPLYCHYCGQRIETENNL